MTRLKNNTNTRAEYFTLARVPGKKRGVRGHKGGLQTMLNSKEVWVPT